MKKDVKLPAKIEYSPSPDFDKDQELDELEFEREVENLEDAIDVDPKKFEIDIIIDSLTVLFAKNNKTPVFYQKLGDPPLSLGVNIPGSFGMIQSDRKHAILTIIDGTESLRLDLYESAIKQVENEGFKNIIVRVDKKNSKTVKRNKNYTVLVNNVPNEKFELNLTNFLQSFEKFANKGGHEFWDPDDKDTYKKLTDQYTLPGTLSQISLLLNTPTFEETNINLNPFSKIIVSKGDLNLRREFDRDTVFGFVVLDLSEQNITEDNLNNFVWKIHSRKKILPRQKIFGIINSTPENASRDRANFGKMNIKKIIKDANLEVDFGDIGFSTDGNLTKSIEKKIRKIKEDLTELVQLEYKTAKIKKVIEPEEEEEEKEAKIPIIHVQNGNTDPDRPLLNYYQKYFEDFFTLTQNNTEDVRTKNKIIHMIKFDKEPNSENVNELVKNTFGAAIKLYHPYIVILTPKFSEKVLRIIPITTVKSRFTKFGVNAYILKQNPEDNNSDEEWTNTKKINESVLKELQKKINADK